MGEVAIFPVIGPDAQNTQAIFETTQPLIGGDLIDPAWANRGWSRPMVGRCEKGSRNNGLLSAPPAQVSFWPIALNPLL